MTSSNTAKFAMLTGMALISVGASPRKKTPRPSARYELTIVDHIVRYGSLSSRRLMLSEALKLMLLDGGEREGGISTEDECGIDEERGRYGTDEPEGEYTRGICVTSVPWMRVFTTSMGKVTNHPMTPAMPPAMRVINHGGRVATERALDKPSGKAGLGSDRSRIVPSYCKYNSTQLPIRIQLGVTHGRKGTDRCEIRAKTNIS